MKKFTVLLLLATLLSTTLSACLKTETPTPSQAPSPTLENTQAPSDAVTSASEKESSDPDDIINGLSSSGYWIFAVLSDVTLEDELIVSGDFHDKDDPTAKVYRKLALYAQDSDHNVTAHYTLTVPKITVNSPAFRIQNGTVNGDVYVNAEGFELSGSTIQGNLTFATQAYMDSANLEKGTVTGTVSVG